MLLYRVHLKDDISRGMYNSNCSNNLFELGGRHPGPSDDSMLCAAWDTISSGTSGSTRPPWWFGFGSLEQFSNWVYRDEWWKNLTDEGYVISMIEVPDDRCHLGYTQAVMHKYYCTIVKSVPVVEWETLR